MGASLDHADASVRRPSLMAELSLSTDAAAYIGDDVPDLPLMHAGAFSATPRNGHASVQQHASLTTVRGGARVAVREACEFNLETQGKLATAQAASLPPVDGQ